MTDSFAVACNHTRIEFICRPPSSLHHRWYGCLDCGAVFEVAEQTMISPEKAAKILPRAIDYKEQHKVASFRAEGIERPAELPFCPGCDAPHAGLGGHTCARFGTSKPVDESATESVTEMTEPAERRST